MAVVYTGMPSMGDGNRMKTDGQRVEVLALIPARSGSKSIADKNIREIAGKPLIAHSIDHALASALVTRTIVSTDSPEYAEIARKHGAEVPFLRPEELARDDSADLGVFQHALSWLREEEGYEPEICVHLRPTCPLRDPAMIDEAVRMLVERPDLDSVRTVTAVLHPPFKMWYRGDDGMLEPVVTLPDIEEPWNEPRQNLPATFIQTAHIDAVRSRVIVEQGSMCGTRIYGLAEEKMFDIDSYGELLTVSHLMAAISRPANEGASQSGRTFCFDIDGIVATLAPGNDYSEAQPRADVIALVNKVYDAGHRVLLHTARGSVTGIDWKEFTVNQLKEWGVKYHELSFGKPAADFYVDDRMITVDQLDGVLRRLSGDNTT